MSEKSTSSSAPTTSSRFACTLSADSPTFEPCEREPHLLKYGAAYVFYALMDTVVDRYFPILDALETEFEKIEEQIFLRNTARSNIEALYALKRSLMILKHAVDPLMEAVSKL